MSEKKSINHKYKFSSAGLLVFCGVFALIGAYFLWQAFAATTCLVSNRTQWAIGGADCTAGTVITVNNQSWACNRSLASYGTLPIKVVSNSTASWGGNAVTLDNGCYGDGNNDTVDLILEINGGGMSSGIGPQDDSAKFRQDPGPRDIQVTGKFECGMPGPGAHPDTWQFQSSNTSNMIIVNGKSGNYANGTSTCQTAGGSIFWSDSTAVDIIGGEYVGCNHGIYGGSGSAQGVDVIDVKFRTGRTEAVAGGGDPNCQGFAASDPCLNIDSFNVVNVTCGRWVPATNTWNERVINPTNNPPPPSPAVPSINLSANPTSVTSGGTSTLTWTTSNATSCTSSGAWTGSRATSGSLSVTPAQTSVYNLTCTGTGGTANASVTVSVTTSSDTTPPTINITAPANNSTVTANVTVSATAQDNVAVRGVQFRLDGNNLNAEDTTAPYSVTWNTASVANGSHTLTAVARDGAGNTATSTPILVTVSNNVPPTDTPPTVSLTSPADNSTVSATVNVTATASDNNSVARVEFLIDGTVRGTDTSSPYNYSWNTTSLSNGNHSVTARAYDNANLSASDQHTVTVQNGDTAPPTAPSNVRATAPAYNRVSLTWNASTDNTAVAGYYIVRNGITIATTNGTGTAYTDNTVSGSTTYSYQVIARDSAGNNSPASGNASVTTPAPPNTADTIAPSTPTNLTATAISSAQINLSWRASSDNVGVTGYDVYRSTTGSAATKIATVTTTSFGNTGLSPNSTYNYYIVAKDGAGNLSVPSGTATATTTAPPPTPGIGVGSLSGRVTSSKTSSLTRANVNITVNGHTQYHTTSSNGTYLIQKLPAGSHSTKYKASGHQHQYIINVINAGQNTVRDVRLQAR